MNGKRKRTKEDEDKEADELAQQLRIVNDEHSNSKKQKLMFHRAGTINGNVEKSSDSRDYITVLDEVSSEVGSAPSKNDDNIKDYHKSKDRRQNSYMEIMNESNGFRGPIPSNLPESTRKAIDISRKNSTRSISDETTTTNLYVQGLPDQISEERIKETFGSYGPLVQIKILEPPRNSNKNTKRCAFVQFASRKDTERALLGMNNEVFDECHIRISFATTQQYSNNIIYCPPPLALYKYTMEKRMPFSANPLPNAEKKFRQSGYSLLQPSHHNFTSGAYQEKLGELALSSVVPVWEPVNELHKQLIDQIVTDCIGNIKIIDKFLGGIQRMVHDLPLNHKHRSFYINLFTYGSRESNYFIWRAFSVMNGDTFDDWMKECYRIFEGGPVWIPPHSIVKSVDEMPEFLYHTAYNYKETSSKESRETGLLPENDKDHLLSLLSSGTLENSSVANLLHFCGKHTNEAKEVFKYIISFLDTTKDHVNILNTWYLISELIHNYREGSNSAKFEKYYTETVENINDIVDKVKQAIDNVVDRTDKEELRQKYLKVVKSWQNSEIFNDETLQSISNKLYGYGNTPIHLNRGSQTKTSSKKKTPRAKKTTPDYNDWKKKYFADYVKKTNKNTR
uniref:RRM domain-containing protein n=1 Tax=Strongyloides papillosus TaxID=174720 RepID=A0A0N5BR24_STREA